MDTQRVTQECRQFNVFRKTIPGMSEKFSKEKQILKKNPIEIMQTKNSVSHKKNRAEILNRLDKA